MKPAFLVRFRPQGPWRFGPDTGARDRVDRIFHSDSLFSAVTHAMDRLGKLDDWLKGTVANGGEPAVRLSSLFPCLDEMLFVSPPRHLWPPPPSAKVRWRNAEFVPLSLVGDLIAEKMPNDNRWRLDGASGCLLPNDASYRMGPFRSSLRSHAAVDRPAGGTVDVHRTACLEFSEGGGFWGAVGFANDEAAAVWSEALKAALRLLADTGVGGERSLGWGRSEAPEFKDGTLPDLILPARPAPEPPPEVEGEAATAPRPAPETAYWLLSLFSPATGDSIDWQRGAYALAERAGRVESAARSGEIKKAVRMVEEGSVLVAGAPLAGAAQDVAPDGFPHPVFRSGLAFAIPVPYRPPVGAS